MNFNKPFHFIYKETTYGLVYVDKCLAVLENDKEALIIVDRELLNTIDKSNPEQMKYYLEFCKDWKID